MSLFAPSRWPWLRRWFGRRSERAAERFLRRLGYRILRCNYLCPGGELDLVALDGRCLVFVEVRSTAATDPERPTQSVNNEKQRRMTHAALHFLHHHRIREPSCRFDVLILCWPEDQQEPSVRHFPNAFEAIGLFQMDH